MFTSTRGSRECPVFHDCPAPRPRSMLPFIHPLSFSHGAAQQSEDCINPPKGGEAPHETPMTSETPGPPRLQCSRPSKCPLQACRMVSVSWETMCMRAHGLSKLYHALWRVVAILSSLLPLPHWHALVYHRNDDIPLRYLTEAAAHHNEALHSRIRVVHASGSPYE